LNGWELVVESALLLTSVVGICISAVLTTDSWVRYLRVRALLNGNYFPRMHLRVDFAFFAVQLTQATISGIWFIHLLQREPAIVNALDHLWPVFPLRFGMVLLLVITQAWNAWDRHRMHFGENARAVPPPYAKGAEPPEPAAGV